MSAEKAGEQVFTNIDKVLTEKIIFRCKENSKESEPSPEQTVNENYTAKKLQLFISIKWLAAAAGFVLLIALIFLRKSGKSA